MNRPPAPHTGPVVLIRDVADSGAVARELEILSHRKRRVVKNQALVGVGKVCVEASLAHSGKGWGVAAICTLLGAQ